MQQQVPLLPDLAAKAPPPAAGLQEGDPAAQIHWMNRVAMVLDDLLAATAPRAAAAAHSVAPNADSPSELRAARGDAPAASVSGACCGWAASPSARFQALLVHARRKGCLQGYYEAMLQRCALRQTVTTRAASAAFFADIRWLTCSDSAMLWAAVCLLHLPLLQVRRSFKSVAPSSPLALHGMLQRDCCSMLKQTCL